MRVYRYFDTVAVSPPTGATFYLTQAQAADLAFAITTARADILANQFTKSTLQPVAIDGVAASSRELLDNARRNPAQVVR